ncbi:MAG: ABC transporter substrate-binding protein [Firmicutes bacterium]|nr:ABC transporter substrate-binding protein [Bacillota bacterium]
MKKKKVLVFLLAVSLIVTTAFSLTGCGKKTEPAATNQTAPAGEAAQKIRVGIFATVCEVPIFAAYEKGFFKAEGLDVELIRGDANTLKEGLATGKIDATDGVLMQWIKPIEQGLDVKFTAGIHTGCIQVLVPPNSNIKTVKDFKGKTIGVTGIGGGPMNLVSRVLADNGVDLKNDVTWKAYPAAELELALEKGEVDIISLPDPVAQLIVNKGKAVKFIDMAKDEPYKSEYCCLVVQNGKFLRENPEKSAAVTRAILKAAEWVSKNPEEAAKLSVDNKYVPGDYKVNADILAGYNYQPSVDGGEKALAIAAKKMQEIGILDPSTNTDELAKKTFVRQPGVNY